MPAILPLLEIQSKMSKYRLESDLSKGKALYPIPVINTVDNEEVDSRFHYVRDCVDDKELTDKLLKGCDCVGGKCVRGSCACIDNSTIELYPDGRVKNAGALYEKFDSEILYECDAETCKCLGGCAQRMSPEKFNLKVELYKTPKAGWAVRSRQFIEVGTFVGEFVGEILSLRECEIRSRPQDYSYFVNNQAIKSRNRSRNCDTAGHYVDPTRYGNVTRFFNHSCFENLLPIQFFSWHRDKERASIGFIACRNILPGTDLTIDYGQDWWKEKIGMLDDFYCQCGWVYCAFPSPDQHQITPTAAKKEASRIVEDDHEKIMVFKRKKLQEQGVL